MAIRGRSFTTRAIQLNRQKGYQTLSQTISATMATATTIATRAEACSQAAVMAADTVTLTKAESRSQAAVTAVMSVSLGGRALTKALNAQTAAVSSSATRSLARSVAAVASAATSALERSFSRASAAIMVACTGSFLGSYTQFLTFSATLLGLAGAKQQISSKTVDASTTPSATTLKNSFARTQTAATAAFTAPRSVSFVRGAVNAAMRACSVAVAIVGGAGAHFVLSFSAVMNKFTKTESQQIPFKHTSSRTRNFRS